MTLLEVLVAKVLSQSMRIEQGLSDGRYDSGVHRLRLAWLAESIRAMQASPLDAEQVLSASGRRLRFETLSSPLAPRGGVGVVEVEFSYDTATDSTSLNLRDSRVASDTLGGSGVRLLSWQGRQGGLKYLDHLGGLHSEWNPKSSALLRLHPSAILVETGLRGWEQLIIQIDASPVAPVSRKQVDSL
jgi:hypothetical protein